MAVFGLGKVYDCWLVFEVYYAVEIQDGVVHSPRGKCHCVDGWASIGCDVGFLIRGWWCGVMNCECGL